MELQPKSLTIHNLIGKILMVHKTSEHYIVCFVKFRAVIAQAGVRSKNIQKHIRKENYLSIIAAFAA